MRRNILILVDGAMALFPDDISLTFRDDGVWYPAANKLMAISDSGVERLAGATRQIAH
jgi:hypothetical protein